MLYANYSGTSPLGHLYSDPLFNRQLSSGLQGAHNLVPENVQIIFVPVIEAEHLYPGERDTFCGSRDPLTSIPATVQPRSQGAFFLALGVGRERAMASAGQSVILIGCSTSKASEKRPGDEVGDSIYRTLALVPRVSLEWRFHCISLFLGK